MRNALIIIITLVFSAAINAANTWVPAPGDTHGISTTVTAWNIAENAGAQNTPVKPAVITAAAEPLDEGQQAYDELASADDFNYRPAYVESKYGNNELVRDIAVSAVEAVPFGFILTFAGIFVVEAASQQTFQPKYKSLEEYTPAYAISIGCLAALNVVINTLFFYDYSKEEVHVKKAEEK